MIKRLIMFLILALAATAHGAVPFPEAVSTSTTTLTLQPTVGVYTFTGASPATWTLPAVSGNKDRQIIIKNRGSATITVQRAGSDQLYTTTTATSTTVAAGSWAKFVNDSVYWNVLTAGSGGLASTDIDTSAELAAILTDETGSGAAVFGTSPTFAGGTVTSSTPIITGTQTWNSAGTVFNGLLFDVTDSAGASASSTLLSLRTGGSNMFRVYKGGAIESASTMTSGASVGVGAGNVFLSAVSSGVLEQRNGATAQVNYVYQGYTDASNYSRLRLGGFSGNIAELVVDSLGTGVVVDQRIGTEEASGRLLIKAGGSDRWIVTSSGNLTANTDNAVNIGASGANRPKDVYIAGNLTAGAGANVKITANRNALADYGRFMVQQNGTDKWGIGSRGDEAANNMLIVRDETNSVNVLSLYQGASGASQVAMVGSVQNQQASKTLTKSAATAFVQVAVASGSMVGGVVHYTVTAQDATPTYQVHAGTIPFAAFNNAGTETCTFGTAADASALSAGTFATPTFDADNSPTNAVNLRCNAAPSITPTTLAIRYWVEITGSTVTVTPQ